MILPLSLLPQMLSAIAASADDRASVITPSVETEVDQPESTAVKQLPFPLSSTQPDLPASRSRLAVEVEPSSLPPPEVLAKSDFMQGANSNAAIDLMDSPTAASTPVSASQMPAVPSKWLVATTHLPAFSELVAADPGGLELPPVFNCPNPDPELGCIRLQDPSFPAPAAPILYLTPRVDFFRSNNLLLGIDPINAGLVRPSLTLLAIPPLGKNTFLLLSADGAFNRYFEVPQFNYDELRVRAGILQRLSPNMTVEIGWTNQQLFIANNEISGFPAGTRFLNDQAIRLELSRRDQLSDRLFLNSVYQFRLGLSDPADRSRILNVAFLSLNYDLNSSRTLQLGIDYQFSAANYTVVRRTDIYQQLLGRLTLIAFRNTQLSLYGGISFGSSTEPGINFDSYVLGVSMSLNLVLF